MHNMPSMQSSTQLYKYKQGCRKYEFVQYNRILNPKLSNNMGEKLPHFAKHSKNINMFMHPQRQFKAKS